MHRLFRRFRRSPERSRSTRRHTWTALIGTVWTLTILLQLLLPAIKVKAATDTIPLVRSNPSIQCWGQITVDTHYVDVGTPMTYFQQAADPPAGNDGIAFATTQQAVAAGQPMPYIFFSSDNTSSSNACYFAGMLWQLPGQGPTNSFYGYVYDDADGGTRSPIPVAALGTADPANKVINFTSQPYPGANIKSVGYSLKVRDPNNIFGQSAFFPQPSGSGSGGGTTSAGPCSIFQDQNAINACQLNPTPKFVDIATISYRGETYTTSHWGGSKMNYYLSATPEPNRKAHNIDAGDACRPYFTIDTDGNASQNNGLDINIDDVTTNDLQQIEDALARAEAAGYANINYTDFNYSCAKNVDNVGIKIGDTVNARIWAGYYGSSNTVNLFFTDADGNESPYLSVYKTSDEKTFNGTALPGCEVSAPHFDFGTPLNAMPAGASTVSGKWYINISGDCEHYAIINVRARIEPKDAQPPVIKTAAATDNSTNVHVDCEWSFNPLTWVMCPLLDGLQAIINSVGNFIKDQLQIDANRYFDKSSGGTGEAIYSAWNSIRLISMALLVIIALVMVMAQALSIDAIDAYTVKKVLPRLALAVVGISLSWEITRLLVIFSNDLAKAVEAIILTPFSGLKNATLAGGQVSLAAAGLAAVGIAFLLTIFAAAALALLMAFVAIVLRQMIIIFLVIVSPIAILASILPNTQKAWKIWHETFNGALLVYSIIIGFIALGAVFGKIADGLSSPAAPFIAFIATYIPYFLIPKAFTMASGLIGTLGGMVNDRGKGAFDKLRKRRGEIMKNRYERAKNESLYNPNHPALQKMNQYKWGRRLNPNKLATWAAAPHKNLAYATRGSHIPFLSASGRRLAGSIRSAKMEQSEKALQHVNKHGANDKFYRAIGGMYNGFNKDTQEQLITAGFAKRNANGHVVANRSLRSERDFTKMAEILERSSSDSERKAAVALRGNASYMAGLYTDPEMNYVDSATVGALGLASHQFFDSNDAADVGNLMTRESGGDLDYAHSAVVQAEVIGARGHPETKAGYGHVIDEHGNFVAGTDIKHNRSWAVAGTLGAGDIGGMKGDGLNGDKSGEGFGGDLIDMLKAGDPNHSDVEVRNHLRKAGLSEAEIDKRFETASKDHRAIKSTLMSVASGASYASADVKSQAERILRASGYGEEFDRFVADPEAMQRARLEAEREGAAKEPPPGAAS